MSKSLSDYLESWDVGIWGTIMDNPVKGVSVLRSTNFTNDGEICFKNQVFIEIQKEIIQEKRLQKGDILLERSGGGPKQPVGRVALLKQNSILQ